MRYIFGIIIFILCIGLGVGAYSYFSKKPVSAVVQEKLQDAVAPLNPLSIDSLRKGTYEGSGFVIEQTLPAGSNYKRYIASYMSEGLKIYGLLTVPNGKKPEGGYPAIVFNHGYIPPDQYKTTEKYVAYVDAFARNGYVVFKSDYRGHGSSQGESVGAYGNNSYTIDVLNAVASVKKHTDVNPEKIGMWGYSMGGYITLRCMVTSKDIKAGVVWGGVVASTVDIITAWHSTGSATTVSPETLSRGRRWRSVLIDIWGTPTDDSEFWRSLSANSYLSDISGPLQLHHGEADETVPLVFSQKLYSQMQAVRKPVELYTYTGDNHNISKSFSKAMQRSVAFFDTYLKTK